MHLPVVVDAHGNVVKPAAGRSAGGARDDHNSTRIAEDPSGSAMASSYIDYDSTLLETNVLTDDQAIDIEGKNLSSLQSQSRKELNGLPGIAIVDSDMENSSSINGVKIYHVQIINTNNETVHNNSNKITIVNKSEDFEDISRLFPSVPFDDTFNGLNEVSETNHSEGNFVTLSDRPSLTFITVEINNSTNNLDNNSNDELYVSSINISDTILESDLYWSADNNSEFKTQDQKSLQEIVTENQTTSLGNNSLLLLGNITREDVHINDTIDYDIVNFESGNDSLHIADVHLSGSSHDPGNGSTSHGETKIVTPDTSYSINYNGTSNNESLDTFLSYGNITDDSYNFTWFTTREEQDDLDHMVDQEDALQLLTVNGKPFPFTIPIQTEMGEVGLPTLIQTQLNYTNMTELANLENFADTEEVRKSRQTQVETTPTP